MSAEIVKPKIAKPKKVKQPKIKYCDDCKEAVDSLKHGLCDKCVNLDKNKFICKSTIKKEYKLNDEDIDDLVFKEVKNPHYRCAGSMKLYNLLDIKNRFAELNTCDLKEIKNKQEELEEQQINKKELLKRNKEVKDRERLELFDELLEQNGLSKQDHSLSEFCILRCKSKISMTRLINKIKEIKKRIHDFKERMRQDNILNIEQNHNLFSVFYHGEYTENEFRVVLIREENLKRELAKYNLKIRCDSRLCNEYLEEGFGDPEKIALTMKQMEWFFENSNYKTIMNNLMSDRDNRMYRDVDSLSNEAKIKALDNYLKNNNMEDLPEYMIKFLDRPSKNNKKNKKNK